MRPPFIGALTAKEMVRGALGSGASPNPLPPPRAPGLSALPRPPCPQDHAHTLVLLDQFTLASAAGNAHTAELLAAALALDLRLHCQVWGGGWAPRVSRLLIWQISVHARAETPRAMRTLVCCA